LAISEQWAELLEPGLRSVFQIQKDALAATSRIPLLFNVMTSQKAREHFLGMGGMSDWDQYDGAMNYDDIEKLYETTLTHQEFVKGFTVQRKLVDDDQYNVITPQPKQLALSAMRTREKHAASVFNNAFTPGYVGGDGVALCSSSHPLAPAHASDVQSNVGNLPLNGDNVIATRKLMRKYVDDRGQLIVCSPDTLVVPPELEDVSVVIQKSQLKPGTADNDANYAASLVKNIVVWDYLTDSNNWFMVDSVMADMYLMFIDRVPLEFAMDPTSDFSLWARYRGYMRYSYGWSDYRWVYGHNVSG